MPSLFETSQDNFRQAHSGGSRRGPGGQTQEPTYRGTILHSGGALPALQLEQSQRLRQHQLLVEQQLRQMNIDWKVSAPQRAERVAMGKAPILPTVKPIISRPASTGLGQHNGLYTFDAFKKAHPDYQNGRWSSTVIKFIFDQNGGSNAYRGANGSYNRIGSLGTNWPDAHSMRVADTEDPQKYNTSVNGAGQFIFNNVYISDKDFLNYIMGNFISGLGPENYVFPTDGIISKRASEGETFKTAVNQWYELNRNQINNGRHSPLRGYEFKVDYGIPQQSGDIIRDKTFFTIPNFIGSAWATVDVVNQDSIKVTIFNVTSLTSGDLLKHSQEWPKSLKRLRGVHVPYGNISTTFSVTLSVDYAHFVDEMLDRQRLPFRR